MTGEDQGPVIRAGGRWVIETVSRRGAGVPEDRVREVTQFWSNSGRLLAEQDPDRTPEQWEIVMGRADWTDRMQRAAESVLQNAEELYGVPSNGLDRLLITRGDTAPETVTSRIDEAARSDQRSFIDALLRLQHIVRGETPEGVAR